VSDAAGPGGQSHPGPLSSGFGQAGYLTLRIDKDADADGDDTMFF
jgi:hypothetical protein